ncbi:S8 family serine peptidase [Filimonas effusa]|uniref:Protease n=1 Tax=Filimonas effusa TaxID=2508721 RepID=A0A4Q1DAE1_9BACT|nr:S8 family serine peptidase [Filimonas effusa]RXK86374.1 protease [Filimonas effusa]
MKKPILGKRTFLRDNTVPAIAFEKAMTIRHRNTFSIAAGEEQNEPLYTGRYIAVLKEGADDFKHARKVFTNNAGMKISSINDFNANNYAAANEVDADVITYDQLGVALISGEPEQISTVSAMADNEYIIIPERIAYVPEDLPALADRDVATWGLNCTDVLKSTYTGNGVKVAILDTGFTMNHPDFAGRNITAQSFVDGDTDPMDHHGHGTHCTGTACGGIDANGLRYGVATKADIYIGKVLGNNGSGSQQSIWNGILWAADSGCKVISMSLESPVFPGQNYDLTYERFAKYASAKGAIVIAAAGNGSKRNWGHFTPVSSPADCPSVLAVAALDSNMNVADFSNRCINPTAQVDIAAPGYDIYSSWTLPQRYNRIHGTSMATPHVAGILALLWEQYPNYSPSEITVELFKFAKRLALPSIDVGIGLVMAK